MPKSSDSAGTASASSTALASPAESHGRRITSSDQRSQKLVSRSRFGRTRRYSPPVKETIRPGSSARRPSSAISAGSSVTAEMIDSATTTIAPIASEWIAVESIRNSPASEISTVTPEKTTVAPDVRIATSSACSRVLPACSSSR